MVFKFLPVYKLKKADDHTAPLILCTGQQRYFFMFLLGHTDLFSEGHLFKYFAQIYDPTSKLGKTL